MDGELRGEWSEDETRFVRVLKQKELDKEIRKLLSILREREWEICNENVEGNEGGGYICGEGRIIN